LWRVGIELRTVSMMTRKKIARRMRRVMVGCGSGIVDLYDRLRKFLRTKERIGVEVAFTPIERDI
jgi:hypothetical protein